MTLRRTTSTQTSRIPGEVALTAPTASHWRGTRTASVQRPTTRPTVSVVIPCFNYEAYLAQAVSSALVQEHVDVRVIIVDDASSDGSLSLANSLARDDQRIEVIANRQNTGPVETFNRGLAAVRSDYVVRLDADDLLTRGSLARATALLERYQSVGLVYGHPVHFVGNPPATTKSVAGSWTIWEGHRWLAYRARRGTNCITSPEAVMRASVLQSVGGQRPLDQTHDMEMWLRIAAVSDVARVNGADQALHREHSASRSATMVNNVVDLQERLKAFELLFDWLDDEVPELGSLRGIARESLASEALVRACQAIVRGRAGDPDVAAYVQFAHATFEDVGLTPAGRRWAAHMWAGPRYSRAMPHLVAQAAATKAVAHWHHRRWHRTGV